MWRLLESGKTDRQTDGKRPTTPNVTILRRSKSAKPTE